MHKGVNNCERSIKTKKANHFHDSLIGRFVETLHATSLQYMFGLLRTTEYFPVLFSGRPSCGRHPCVR